MPRHGRSDLPLSPLARNALGLGRWLAAGILALGGRPARALMARLPPPSEEDPQSVQSRRQAGLAARAAELASAGDAAALSEFLLAGPGVELRRGWRGPCPGDSAMLAAALREDIACAAVLARAGFIVKDAEDGTRLSPLETAAQAGREAFAKWAMRRGAHAAMPRESIPGVLSERPGPLGLAIDKRRERAFWAIADKARLGSRDKSRLIERAVLSGSEEILRGMLARAGWARALTLARRPKGRRPTLCMRAAHSKSLPVLDLVLPLCDPQARASTAWEDHEWAVDEAALTALPESVEAGAFWVAASHLPNLGAEQCARRLARAGCDVDEACLADFSTLGGAAALHLAAGAASPEQIEWLLELGANPVARDKAGRTPLLWACWSGHLAAFEALAPVSDLLALDHHGFGGLHYLANFDTVLLDHLPMGPVGAGAESFARSEELLAQGRLAIARHLLAAGADPAARAPHSGNFFLSGPAPLDPCELAARSGRSTLFAFFLARAPLDSERAASLALHLDASLHPLPNIMRSALARELELRALRESTDSAGRPRGSSRPARL